MTTEEELTYLRARVADLEERLADFEGVHDCTQTLQAKLRAFVGTKRGRLGISWTTRTIAALYAARGVVAFSALDTMVSPNSYDSCRVGVHRARAVLPPDSIQTVFGVGYRLTDSGRKFLDDLLKNGAGHGR